MLSARLILRSGAVLSVFLHAVLVATVLGLLASPRLFEARREPAVMVDLVSPAEVPDSTNAKGQGHGPDAAKSTAASASPQTAPQAAPQPEPKPEPKGMATFMPARPATPPSIFSVPEIPAMLDLVTPATSASLAPPAEMPADLAPDDVAAFKAHLRTCWNPPADLAGAPKLKVTLRVFLSREGALARQPVLLAASASVSGPALVQAALAALRACQPFSLPADRYNEWKVLDLTLSPADMGGG